MQEVLPDSIWKIHADIIIDARSPKEFIYSHVPCAKNFYALNNQEHQEIGTIYKHNSKFKAKALGASYICANASKHILELQKLINPGSKIVIYCARGGLRSASLGVILEQLEYRVFRVKNGYKGYRNYVLNFFENERIPRFITLFGNTGVGKSELLRKLNPQVDIEALANHQGSTFGAINGAQPTQKTFENNLAFALLNIPNDTLCFVEGESRRVGSITLPKKLYEAMQNGVSVLVEASMEKRVERIIDEYSGISDEFFFACLEKIKPYMAKAAYKKIAQSYHGRELETVAFLLLEHYYDKVYKKPKRVDFKIKSDDINRAILELKEIYDRKL